MKLHVYHISGVQLSKLTDTCIHQFRKFIREQNLPCWTESLNLIASFLAFNLFGTRDKVE